MSVSVVILAAGKGTRMKSDTPKVLHKISGKPMLFYIIDEALELSSDVTIVLNHQFDLVKEQIEANYNSIKIHKQDLSNYPGTGGAIKGLEFNSNRVLILNGDMPLVAQESLSKLTNSTAPISMTILRLQDPSGYGRVVIENENVKEIVEQKDCTTQQLDINSVNAGVYCVDSKLLNNYIPKLDNSNAQSEYYITDIVKMAVDDGLKVEPIEVNEDEFMGINSKLHLSIAEEFMQTKIKEQLMAQGITMRNPNTIYIDSRAKFIGESILENGATIEGECEITESHIKAHSVVEDSIIKNSSIGPMAHIRPKSNITDTHIGNFVEVKKSTLTGVKAGHLSYMGDSEIDEGTNIGAGVITCNYDGKAKYKTKIGKNVFIGSDCQIVAPIKIEDNTMIAAGTTVTKDVPKGALAISRTPQKIVEKFFDKFFNK